MSKTKWYTKPVYLLVALALVAVPVVATPVAAVDGPALDITVDPDGGTIFCGATETLTVTVSNTGAYAEDVVLTAAVASGPATLSPAAVTLYDICDGCSKQAPFSLNCTGKGTVTVNFTATPANGDPAVLQVNYEQICRFDVEITAPQDGDIVDVSDTFGVAAEITSNTDVYCDALNVTLGIVGNASPVGGNASYTINLHAGETEEVNWTVHCDGIGEVDLTVTAVGCNQESPCAGLCADTVKIFQTPPGECEPDCNFTYVILPYGFGCDGDQIDEDICVCDTFDVKVAVNNTGDACGGAISGSVEMRATGYAHEDGQPETDKSITEPFGPIAVGGSQILTFTWHCYDAEDNCDATLPLDLFQSAVSFEARAWGHCENPVAWKYMPIGTQNWTHYWGTPALSGNYINQTWIDLKLFDDWTNGNPICTCRDYCLGDDILVYPRVRNCGNATLKNAEVFFLGMAGNITWEGVPKDSIWLGDILAGQTVVVDEAFHFKCNATGEAWLSFKVAGVYLPARTVCDVDEINLHQKNPGAIKVEVTVDDCQQYCDEFDVTATVTNEGTPPASPIENVVVDITPSGDVEPVSGPVMTGDTDLDGLLDENESWVYTWTYHCNGPADASFEVDVSGDALCGEPLVDSDSADAEQIKLDIDIITPEECDIKCVSDTFCVTANITDNDPDTCFDGLNATISFPNGKASIMSGENYTKAFNLLGGDTQQVSWSVHCDAAGDTDIKVEVTGTASDSTETSTCDKCTLHNKFDTITIFQIGRPNLKIEITSPDNLDTFVATSQDFAVTVTIDNNTDLSDVTVTDIELNYCPESGATIVQAPEVPFTIGEGETTKVTWTMHCEEPGLLTIWANATAENEIGCVEEAGTCPLALWQYPAASLEVDIIRVEPDTTITVCENFTVVYEVNNTGAADATDVVAELSVIPGGSARPVEGIGSGYTQRIGTIPAGGGTGELVWNLHCKVACESNIVITAKGNDEYGWHKKQECQSTGNFIIEEGYEYFEVLDTSDTWWEWVVGDGDADEHAAWSYGYFEGDANGLIGPFNFDSDLQFAALGGGPDFFGHITGMGVVMPNMADGKDVLAWVAHIKLDPYFEGLPSWISMDFDVYGGLLQIINGNLNGAYLKGDGGPVWEVGLLNGTYCSTMAKEALRPINPDFIESDTVTVKQIMPAQLVVEIDFPYEGFRTDATEEYDVTAAITNIGDETAEAVDVSLGVDDYATIIDADPAAQDIAGGDSVSVSWEVTCTEAGFSVFTATAAGTGELSSNAVEAFDTVTVKQGEVPLAQLVVEIQFPENGDEFIEGDVFPVTAQVRNIGQRVAEDVELSIDTGDNADEDSGPSGTWPKNIAPTSSVAATWMVECTAAGFSVITVEATGDSTNNACNAAVDTVTVKQVPVVSPEPYLTVDVSAPAQIYEGENYHVTAVVSNIGDGEASGVEATIAIEGNAELVTAGTETKTVGTGTIGAGSSGVVEWELNCTGEGGVNIAVSASGTGTNTAADSVAVQQINVPVGAPALTVDVTAPAQVYVGQDYAVTAVVSNIGDVNAPAVDATLVITGDASVVTSPTGWPQDIAAGSSADATWELTCTGEGGVTVTVTAVGTDTNTAVGAAAVQQGVIMWSGLEVTPTSGEAPLTITASADITNSGGMAVNAEAELKVDGAVVDSETVTVGAGVMQTVSFDYTLGEGTYDVTINDLSAITVTVGGKTIQLYAGANPILYTGTTGDFPDVLTNIGPAGLDVAKIIWERDVSTGGEWWYYNVALDYSGPAEFSGLINGKVYIVFVSDACVWELA